MGKRKPNLEEIINTLREQKEILKERYGLKEIGLFGSYVRGEQKRGSDLDVLVDFEENIKLSLLDFIEIELHLSEVLGLKVDLVEKSSLKPYIGKRVLEEVIYL